MLIVGVCVSPERYEDLSNNDEIKAIVLAIDSRRCVLDWRRSEAASLEAILKENKLSKLESFVINQKKNSLLN